MKNIQLYVLEDSSFTGDYAFGEPYGKRMFGDAPHCPACGDIIGMLEWLPPYRIKFDRGMKTNKPGDVIFGVYPDFMVSLRFKEIWEKEGLEGIVDWRPVEVATGKYKGMEVYYPTLKPRTAKPDFRRTRVAWGEDGPPKCDVCMRAGHDAIKQIYLLEDTIPSDDIFHSRGLTEIFASEKFKDIVESYEILSAELVLAKDFEWDPAKHLK